MSEISKCQRGSAPLLVSTYPDLPAITIVAKKFAFRGPAECLASMRSTSRGFHLPHPVEPSLFQPTVIEFCTHHNGDLSRLTCAS